MDDQFVNDAAKNFTKAVFQHESGTNYDATGDAGTSKGAGQWQGGTWKEQAKNVLGDENAPMTPDNQSVVAQGTFRHWFTPKEKGGLGLDAAQAAAKWNSGSEHGWENKVGTTTINGQQIKYNVPQYVKSVTELYQGYKTQGGVPTAEAAGGPEAPKPDQGETYGATFPAAPGDSVATTGLKAVGNVPSSIFNLGKGLLSAVAHPIDTAKGVFNAVAGAGEKEVRLILEKTPVGNIKMQDGTTLRDRVKSLPPDQQESTFNAIVGAMKDRYGSLEAAQKSATNDPVGVGADIFSILEGGAGLAGKAGAVDAAVSTIAKPVVKTGEGLLSIPKKVVSETMGLQTGVGSEPIKAGYQAAREGGAASKAFTESLRGKTSPDQLVEQAKNALGEVVTERGNKYKEMLKTLGNDTTTYDISPVTKELDKQLGKFNISRADDGTLDFSRSKFALDPAGQKDIQNLTEYVKGYGSQAGDRTALGIDNLKQVLGGYFSPNSDYRAFVQGLKGATRGVLEKAPGYSEAMKNYSDASDYIKDLQQSLSLGDKAMVETTFKKLTSSLKNNDFRKQILESLDKDTGGQLVSKIAGQRLNPLAPRGLAQYVTTGVGGLTLAASGGIMPLLGLAITTSPRLVGEFVRALGIGANKANQVMKLLNKVAKPAVVGGTINNRTIAPSAIMH